MSKHYVDLNQIIDHLEDEWGYEGMREELYEIPPADVVEVVRCKDCKHFIKSINKGCCRRVGYFLPDDFCSYGERRETE